MMVERRPGLTVAAHALLIASIAIIAFPVWMTFVAATQPPGALVSPPTPILPGGHGIENFRVALTRGMERAGGVPVGTMLLNSMVMALGITVGKIAISLLSAYAIVYFRFRFKMVVFWLIFITLMLPVEVRILPTFEVISALGMLDSYAGLTIPLIASATATFLFRQFFLTVPEEYLEAARMDGAGPWRFFRDILLPLSRTNIAALFVILFIYGWNQYLWPLIVTTEEDLYTIVMGINRMVTVSDEEPNWPVVMATALLSMVPPVVVIAVMQRFFVKGLIDSEK